MIPPLKNSLCIHALTDDLKFLNPVKNRMIKLLGPQLKVCELIDPASHVSTIIELRKATVGFVVIFAHGSGNYLRGGEYRSRTTGEAVEIDKFLTRKDLSAFKGKVVFCMSCESNDLAEGCLKAGALAFVGFEKIPFNRFDADGNTIGSAVLVMHCQKLIEGAIKASLERFLTSRASLDETVDYLRLWINKNAVAYVRKYKNVKERHEVAALLLKLKDGVRYHGPLGIRFESNP